MLKVFGVLGWNEHRVGNVNDLRKTFDNKDDAEDYADALLVVYRAVAVIILRGE